MASPAQGTARPGGAPPEQGMTVVEHLEELRYRILVSLGAVVAFAGIGYAGSGWLLDFLRRPLGGANLIMTSLGEAFFGVLRLAVAFGAVAAAPVVLYQLWAFVAPALEPGPRRLGAAFVTGAVLLFWGGMAFAYWLMLPVAVRFFIAFGAGVVRPFLSLGAYLSFVLTFLFAFGLAFELPVILFLLMKGGVVSPAALRRRRRHAVLVIVVFAAVISPTTDAVSLALLALPLWFLFELSLLLGSLAR